MLAWRVFIFEVKRKRIGGWPVEHVLENLNSRCIQIITCTLNVVVCFYVDNMLAMFFCDIN